MKPKIVFFILLFSTWLNSLEAQDSFKDPRDGQEYRSKEINNVVWMIDNLNYKTDLSLAVDHSRANAPNGRFYHLYELDSICPNGWGVSKKDDWLTYFEYLINNSEDSSLTISENKMDEIVEIDHWGKINTFDDINPLEITHTGWVEGGEWIDMEQFAPYNANYWVLEPSRDELERTHVHIGETRIRIHRHKHHLKPKQEEKLRQFMVRCVKN